MRVDVSALGVPFAAGAPGRLRGALPCLLALICAARGEEEPETPRRAGDRVVAAWRAGDRAALATLAAREDPDPWLVVDDLIERGEGEAARAFAAVARGWGTKGLDAYAASPRARASPEVRAAVSAALKLASTGRAREALDALEGVELGRGDVVSLKGRFARAVALLGTRDFERSESAFLDVALDAEELGWLAHALPAWQGVGDSAYSRGDFAGALPPLERRLALQEESGNAAGTARVVADLGRVLKKLGRYAEALERYERSLGEARRLGLEALEAGLLNNIGNVYNELGDHARALSYLERALALYRKRGDRAGVARTLGNIANNREETGEPRKALELQEESLALARECGDAWQVAIVLGNMGNTLKALGEHGKAREHYEQALAAKRELGDVSEVAKTLENLGTLHQIGGDDEAALACFGEALALAERSGSPEAIAWVLMRIGGACGEAGRFEEAAAAARRAAELVFEMGRGQAEAQGAAARARYSRVFAVGAYAAVEMGDPATLFWFLEAGRAGTLLEALAMPEGEARVPEDLRAERAAAAAAEAEAAKRYAAAAARGDRERINAARVALGAAREALLEVSDRVERARRSAFDTFEPGPVPLADAQRLLRPGEAFVLYFLHDVPGLPAAALVLTAGASRVVRLADAGEIGEASKALRLDPDRGEWRAPVAKLRDLVVVPLGLDDTITTVLVSCEGALSHVPMGLVFGDRDVVHVPSATTYAVLFRGRGGRGQQVLALGDPAYGGTKLSPLPASRAEATAVGDHVLLGDRATESGLRSALEAAPRWRSVHLACHGLVDTERPALSALALAADARDDGLLRPLDIVAMRIPADLVVLSACETAKGRVYEGEGVVGLTRAVMFAGAPRVLVSLWKVDDEATRELMVEFYRRWNPAEGARGAGAAAALRGAKEHVASRERWRHPSYWAAWQLWGLPD